MYKEPVYQKYGFKSHQDFVDTVLFLRSYGISLNAIADIYHVTKQYISKIDNQSKKKGKP